ncbi:MAG: ferric reductase-like transmembrane domain-containing protein [Brevibacillus sp.]|nr:ferric reductase-like transmembrane domain-containing protein [Brevibacillus sp.]
MRLTAKTGATRGFLRVLLHIGILGLLVIISAALWPDFAMFETREAWSMITGYLAFLCIGFTLLIGPLKQRLPGRWTAAAVQLRRDFGIWGGAAALLHVVLVILSFEDGVRFMFFHDPRQPEPGWLHLFLDRQGGEWSLKISMMGIANYLGLLAFAFLMPLWFTSSDRAERMLGGAAWKRLHMSNLMIFVLVTLHALIYVEGIKGEPLDAGDVLPLFVVVLLVRMMSYLVTVVSRRR